MCQVLLYRINASPAASRLQSPAAQFFTAHTCRLGKLSGRCSCSPMTSADARRCSCKRYWKSIMTRHITFCFGSEKQWKSAMTATYWRKSSSLTTPMLAPWHTAKNVGAALKKGLMEKYFLHYETFSPEKDMLRHLHTAISNMKSMIEGTYHGVTKEHLQEYLDEFCFRYSRAFGVQLFGRLAAAVFCWDFWWGKGET